MRDSEKDTVIIRGAYPIFGTGEVARRGNLIHRKRSPFRVAANLALLRRRKRRHPLAQLQLLSSRNRVAGLRSVVGLKGKAFRRRNGGGSEARLPCVRGAVIFARK